MLTFVRIANMNAGDVLCMTGILKREFFKNVTVFSLTYDTNLYVITDKRPKTTTH